MPLKEQFLKKQTVSVKYLLLGGDSRFENFSDLIPSDWLPSMKRLTNYAKFSEICTGVLKLNSLKLPVQSYKNL
jgi:hypothetical protein